MASSLYREISLHDSGLRPNRSHSLLPYHLPYSTKSPLAGGNTTVSGKSSIALSEAFSAASVLSPPRDGGCRLESTGLSRSNTHWVDRLAAWVLPFHPGAGLISVILLSTRGRRVIQGIRSQRQDLYIWAVLAVLGFASVLNGVNVSRGALNWLVPFVFIWVYALGRWSIHDPEEFLRDLLRATGVLALVVVTARVFELEVSLGELTILDRFSGPNARGYVIGQGANGLAVVLEVGAVGGLALMATARTRKERLEGAIIGILSLGAVLVTLSRGALVGIAAAALAGAALINWRLLLWLGGVVAVAAVSSPIVRHRVASIASISANVQRLRIWEGTWRLIQDHPWLGVGPGNFGLVYPQYRLPAEYEHAMSPHNVYLNIISGWGIPAGIVLFGWIAWVMLRRLSRAMAPYQKAVFLILVAFWVHVFFDDLITVQTGLLLGCLDREDSSQPA